MPKFLKYLIRYSSIQFYNNNFLSPFLYNTDQKWDDAVLTVKSHYISLAFKEHIYPALVSTFEGATRDLFKIILGYVEDGANLPQYKPLESDYYKYESSCDKAIIEEVQDENTSAITSNVRKAVTH